MAESYVPEIDAICIQPDRTIEGVGFQKGFIGIYTKSGSCAELTHHEEMCMDVVEGVNPEIAATLKSPLYYFNRLKSRFEGRGDGKLLMETLIKILDEHTITVVNPMVPSGRLKAGPLFKFFMRYGFKPIGRRVLIREPNKV
jgi:hypothetical protein